MTTKGEAKEWATVGATWGDNWAPLPNPRRVEQWVQLGGFQWTAVAEVKRHPAKGEYVACWIDVGMGQAEVERRDYFNDTRGTDELVHEYIKGLKMVESRERSGTR